MPLQTLIRTEIYSGIARLSAIARLLFYLYVVENPGLRICELLFGLSTIGLSILSTTLLSQTATNLKISVIIHFYYGAALSEKFPIFAAPLWFVSSPLCIKLPRKLIVQTS